MAKVLAAAFLACICLASRAHALIVDQVDTFEDGTTAGWQVALLGAAHPTPPVVVPSGGPAGAGDAYLLLTAIGGAGAGSRLSVVNLAQWAGDYVAIGVGTIAMDVLNLGQTELSLRLMFENPQGAPPTDVAVSNAAAILAPGSGWTHVVFTIDPALFTALVGDVATALSTTTALRIFHSVDAGEADVVAGQIGVDNIRAGARVTVPEPGFALLVAALIPAWFAGAMRRHCASRSCV